MGICVDVDKLVKLLGPAKCDYWPRGEDNRRFGLSVSRVLDLIRECLDESQEGWGIGEDPQYLKKQAELLLQEVKNKQWWRDQESRLLT